MKKGLGVEGCVPKVSGYTKTSTLLCSRDQQVYSPKFHRVNLLTKIEEVEEKDEEDCEVDFYDQLREAIEAGNGVLQADREFFASARP